MGMDWLSGGDHCAGGSWRGHCEICVVGDLGSKVGGDSAKWGPGWAGGWRHGQPMEQAG